MLACGLLLNLLAVSKNITPQLPLAFAIRLSAALKLAISA
jgi:hypothetical protein